MVNGLKKVVVIDDERDIRTLLEYSLRIRGYEVHLAEDGLDGLHLIHQVQPDLIVTDVKMPRLNGFDLLTNLRADARYKKTPVVMLTSLTDSTKKSDEEWRASVGVAAFLSKPFDTSQFLAAVDSLLNQAAPIP